MVSFVLHIICRRHLFLNSNHWRRATWCVGEEKQREGYIVISLCCCCCVLVLLYILNVQTTKIRIKTTRYASGSKSNLLNDVKWSSRMERQQCTTKHDNQPRLQYIKGGGDDGSGGGGMGMIILSLGVFGSGIKNRGGRIYV